MMNDGFMERPEHVNDLFSRDAHLTMLSLDRFEQGELSVEACDVVVSHLRDCSSCTGRWEEMRTTNVVLLPPPELRREDAHRRTRAMRTVAIACTVAAAACLMLWVMPQPKQASLRPTAENVLSASPYTTTATVDGFVAAGAGLDVRARAGESPSWLLAQDGVPWDEVITLELRTDEPGWTAVVVAMGGDDEPIGNADGTGGEAPNPDFELLLAPTPTDLRVRPLRVLHESAPNRSGQADGRYVVVHCREAFDLEPDDDSLEFELSSLAESCTVQELTVTRFGHVADS
jgi:hypothetical protein